MIAIGIFSMACLWWQRSGEVAALSVLDIFAATLGRIYSTITPNAAADVAFTTNTIGIANDTAVLATLVYDGTNGIFRVGASSLTITDSFTPEDATIQLTSTAGCDYFEAAVFNRALSASETRILEGIMAWSNGFPQSLGAGHPFLNRPPMLGD